MKRSDINEILGHTRQFFSMHDVHLPPFASFPPTKWQQLDQAAWQEEFKLHAELFDKLAYRLPQELLATKAALEKRLG